MTSYVNGYVERNDVVLLRREGDSLVEDRVPARYVSYHLVCEVGNVPAFVDDPRISDYAVQGEWLRVEWHPGEYDRTKYNEKTGKLGAWISYREVGCKSLEARGVRSFEADVSPLRRHISDTFDFSIAKPRRVYLDIEVDSRKTFADQRSGLARVLCWSLVDTSRGTQHGVLEVDSDDAERRCLADLWRAVAPYDQIVGWNLDGYDLLVLTARSKALGCMPNLRRWLWLDHLLAFKRYDVMSAETGESKQSFKLEDVAQALLGEGKHDVDASKAWHMWEAGGEQRDKLVRYCIQDTALLEKIEAKTGYLELFQTVCDATHVFPTSRSLKPTQQVDGLMLRLGMEKGVHFPTKWYGVDSPDDVQFRGAFVMQPKCSGIVRDVHVADFASLYPSIMITWNLSGDVRIEDESQGHPVCVSPGTGLRTRGDRTGVICIALERLLALRSDWNKRRAEHAPGTPEAKECERRTNAYKQVANSFYGVCGNKYSRFFDLGVSEATTQNGVWLIKKTIEAAETKYNWNATVVYGDTDSLFVVGPKREEFEQFVKWCNSDLYPSLLMNHGCPQNRISLAYEKEFSRLVMTGAKRYIGAFKHYKGKTAAANSKPEIKGLELKRGDANRLARELQAKAIDLLVRGSEDPVDFVELLDDAKQRVLRAYLEPHEFTMSKSLSKPIDEYTTAVPVHVTVAKQLRDRGEDVSVGTRIRYVVVDARTSPMRAIPACDYVGVCDRYYLWETLVYPPTQRLLEAAFPKFDWRQWENARPSRTYHPDQLSLFGDAR